MIDFHNHILPNVDDGPKTIEESLSMLTKAAEQGISDVVNTVHFQHPKMDNKNVDIHFLKSKVEELQNLINHKKINIKIHLSAEVFYLPNLSNIIENSLVTLGNGKYMLIEFSSNIFPFGYEDEIFKLQSNGVTPIIAHPERYRFVQKDIKILKSWIDRGYIIQIDAGSILGHFGTKIKKITIQMINNGFIHLIGSDAHNNKKRNFCLAEAYSYLEKNMSNDLVNQLKNNSMNLLNGNKIDLEITDYNKNKFSFLDIIKSKLP